MPSVSLQATADGQIAQNSPTTNYGADATMNVTSRGNTAPGSGFRNVRSLLLFDLSGIPANATIASATMSLLATSHTASGENKVIRARRVVNHQFDEAAFTWDEYEAGSSWDTAGGDMSGTFVGEDLNMGSADGVKQWNLTTLVQLWVNGTTNYGVLLRASVENATTFETWTFATKEDATLENRPVLDITYVEGSTEDLKNRYIRNRWQWRRIYGAGM